MASIPFGDMKLYIGSSRTWALVSALQTWTASWPMQLWTSALRLATCTATKRDLGPRIQRTPMEPEQPHAMAPLLIAAEELHKVEGRLRKTLDGSRRQRGYACYLDPATMHAAYSSVDAMPGPLPVRDCR